MSKVGKKLTKSEEKLDRVGDVMSTLKKLGNPKNLGGMARFGISTSTAYGIPVPDLRRTARSIGKNHSLAEQLWASRVHEARILASMVDDPKLVTGSQMDEWVNDFDSWDLCDQCCGNLFVKTKVAYKKAIDWSKSDREFIKRASYALIAYMAVHDEAMDNDDFAKLLPLIAKGSSDERNFVKKSVNWALRQIGKRNLELNKLAIRTAKEVGRLDSKSARWIASDALRELESEAVQEKLQSTRT